MGYRLPWSNKSEEAREPDLSRIHCVNDISILNRHAYRRDRTRFGLSPGVVLQGYPSQKGGVWVLEGVLGVELVFLGLDRFHDTPRVPEPYVDDTGVIVMPEDEDEWCSKRRADPPSSITHLITGTDRTNLKLQTVRQLGAIWWANEDTYMDYNLGMDIPPRSKEDSEVIKVGYPATGGVWVLNLPKNEASKKGVGIVYNAHSMEERCRVIELLGGVFYANPDESPELDLKREGRRSGRGGVSEMGLDEERQEMEMEMKND